MKELIVKLKNDKKGLEKIKINLEGKFNINEIPIKYFICIGILEYIDATLEFLEKEYLDDNK